MTKRNQMKTLHMSKSHIISELDREHPGQIPPGKPQFVTRLTQNVPNPKHLLINHIAETHLA